MFCVKIVIIIIKIVAVSLVNFMVSFMGDFLDVVLHTYL